MKMRVRVGMAAIGAAWEALGAAGGVGSDRIHFPKRR